MLQVYTGNGKGKTTAALGAALRALGHGKKVLLIQFMKKGAHFGEVKAARRFKRFQVLQTGQKGWVNKRSPGLKNKQLAEKGLKLCEKAIQSKKYDLIILDELNVALDFGLLEIGQVKPILSNRPRALELIVTGRAAHPQILKLADLASEIRELRHYYKKGITAREGIEY